MKKQTRLKARSLGTPDEFFQTVNRIADLQAAAAVIVAKRDQEIQFIQKQFAASLAPIDDEIDAKLALADAYAIAHRDELLPKGKKSMELAQATFGFRTGNRTVKFTSKKIVMEAVIAALKANHLAGYVALTEEIAKAKILADAKYDEELEADALVTCVGSRVILAEIGLKIAQSETFFIEPKVQSGETLKPAGAAA